jgi:hypothetical protein
VIANVPYERTLTLYSRRRTGKEKKRGRKREEEKKEMEVVRDTTFKGQQQKLFFPAFEIFHAILARSSGRNKREKG